MNVIDKVGEKLPVARINEGVPPGRAQYENWRAGAARDFEFIALDGPDSFVGEGYAYPLGDIVAARAWRSAGLSRHESHHIEQSDPVFWLRRCIAGTEQTVSGSDTYQVGPGEILLRDVRRPAISRSSYVDMQTLVIPAHHIESAETFSESRTHQLFTTSTPEGRVLDDAIEALYLALPETALAEAPGMHSAFIDLLNGLLSDRPNATQSRRIREATFAAMKRFLYRSLDRPEVGVDELCANFHCSRAKVYRLFESTGGVHRFLREQRLLRVAAALTAPEATGSIRQIALQWGFENTTHFNVAFKQTFGVTPGEAMRNAQRSPQDRIQPTGSEDDIRRFHAWLHGADTEE